MEFCGKTTENGAGKKRMAYRLCGAFTMTLIMFAGCDLPRVELDKIGVGQDTYPGAVRNIEQKGATPGTQLLMGHIAWYELPDGKLSENPAIQSLFPSLAGMPFAADMPNMADSPVISGLAHGTNMPNVVDAAVIPSVPEVTLVPDMTFVPEVTLVPDMTLVPEVPNAPGGLDTPSAPDVPIIPAAPDVPAVPNVPTVPNVSAVPTVPNVSAVPTVPDVPAVPTVPDMPAVPDAPDAPVVPGAPIVPNAPDIPNITEGEVVPDPPFGEVVPDNAEEAVPENPSDNDGGTANTTLGFRVDDAGMIYKFVPEELDVSDGYLVLPGEGCSGILKGAFDGVGAGIGDIEIPPNITYIEEGALSGLTELYGIWTDAGNPNYSSPDGVLLDGSGTVIQSFPSARIGIYEVPGDVTGIADYAFANTRLSKLSMRGCSTVEIGSALFGTGDGAGITISAPRNLLDEYKNIFAGYQVTVN